MTSGMLAVGLAVGSGVSVGVAGKAVGVARLPQAVSRKPANSNRMSLVRKRGLQRRMEVFYLIFPALEKHASLVTEEI
jgi:hypothetical protein